MSVSMFCPSCGNELEDSETACPSCGTVISKPQHPDNEQYCPSCGSVTSKDAVICLKCGARLRKVEYPKTPWGKEVRGERSMVIGIVLSIVLMGLGTIYAGKTLVGILLLLLEPVMYVILVITALSSSIVVLVVLLVWLVLWVLSIYSAYISCKTVNNLWYDFQDEHYI